MDSFTARRDARACQLLRDGYTVEQAADQLAMTAKDVRLAWYAEQNRRAGKA